MKNKTTKIDFNTVEVCRSVFE